MHSLSSTDGHIARALLATMLALCCTLAPAHAVPSFGVQTSQPCAACHVGAFGPRLKQAGRDFKLHGYALDDNRDHWVPLNISVRGSFTHTDADQSGGGADGFDVNDNFAFDGMTIAFAGKLIDNLGAAVRLNYNGIKQSWQWGGVDFRYADEATLLGRDLVWGVTVNNGPTRTDLWESTTGGAPTASSGLSRRPRAAPLSSALSGIVSGAGVYAMLDDTFYLEFDAYAELDKDVLNMLGVDRLNGSDTFDGLIPYGRLTVQREFAEGKHFIAAGAFALGADIFPRNIRTAGSNRFIDAGADVMYQWVADPAVAASDCLTARLAYLHEEEDLAASHALFGTKTADAISTWRADVTYAVDATWTGAVHYFQTTGDRDAVRWGTPGGRIDTTGWSAQLDYTPWGKPGSPADWVNGRLTLQYLAYDEFNGRTANASDKNTFLVGIAIAGTMNQ